MPMGFPDFFGQNRNIFGQENPMMQQALMQQYQQNASNQISTTVFINVPSEEVARQWNLPPNTTGSFINTNAGYIYLKTTASSILEPYKFTRIRLEEEPDEQSQQGQQEKSQVNMDEYITKTEFNFLFEPYKSVIDEMQEMMKELK